MCNSGQLGEEFPFCMESPALKELPIKQIYVRDQMLSISDKYLT